LIVKYRLSNRKNQRFFISRKYKEVYRVDLDIIKKLLKIVILILIKLIKKLKSKIKNSKGEIYLIKSMIKKY